MRWCAASIYKAPLISSYRGLNYSDPFGLCPCTPEEIVFGRLRATWDALSDKADRFRKALIKEIAIQGAIAVVTGGSGNAAEVAGSTAGKVVIGESMEARVIPYAEKIGAKYYKPTGKVAANWLRNNAAWIRQQIKAGKEIIDIGEDALRAERSEFYKMEKEIIDKAGYPVTKVTPK